MRARGCRREARRCGWRLCVVCLHYPVRLTTTRTHSCRRMRECADRAADAPLTLLRREHAGTRPPPSPALTCSPSPPHPPPPFNTNRASCQRANWYCIGSRRPTWRLTCAASRRLARWAGSRRCCRCRRVGEGRGGAGGEGGAPSQAALCPSTAALPSDALCNAPRKALCKAPSNALCTAIAGAPGRGSRRGGADHALPCQPAAGR